MSASVPARRAPLTAALLALSAALALTGCGRERASDTTATAGGPAAPSASASTGAPGAGPYVEPGAGDGAPHYNENNAYRREGEMSPAHEADANREAERITPVIERLWKQKKWDPASVRTALLDLGYEEERITQDGKRLGGTLTVREMYPRFETDHYVTPEGALVALRVHDDTCVTAFLQKTNYQVRTNGLYPETGCLEPPAGH
ncbi:hypothetical protein RKD23_000327 [Streptomyces sp. SAI-170]|uniref:hypothetical protein n=1 Tax=Streptomyces sp. SAI-170 TaxID=3377729 RepID=UPI003C7D7C7A